MSNNSLSNQLEATKKLHMKHVKELIEDLRDKDREIRDLKEEVKFLYDEITRLTAPKPTPKQRAERSGIHS